MTIILATTTAPVDTTPRDEDLPAPRGVLHDAWVVARRGLIHMKRQPQALADATIQPVVFVLLFAYVFGGAINVPGGGSYREFLMGGIFAQTIVFIAMGVGVSIAYDRSNKAVDRFRALPILPNRGVDQALAEIARVGARPSTGGFVIGAYPGGTLQPRPEDDAVFAALVEQSLTLNVHVSLSITLPSMLNTLALPAAGRFTGATGHLIDLIFSGVFDRFPDLNLVFAEVDCGWLPYFKEQLDDGYYRYRFRFDLEKLPSEYVEQHVHFTWVTDTYGIDNRHKIGVERMLWSSDYPHGNSNYPNAWSATQASMSRVPLPEKHLMLVGNAQRLYGFGKS